MISNGSPQQYKKLAEFNTLDELNEATRAHLYAHSHKLSKSAIAIFKLIRNHAAKYRGIAYLFYETIAEEEGVSYATVKRAIRALKKYGMIEVHRTTRTKGEVKGGYGHNVFVVKKTVQQDDTEAQDVADPTTDCRDLPVDPSTLTHRQKAGDSDSTSDRRAQNDEEAVSCEAISNNIINNTYYSPSYARFRKVIGQFINAKQRTISRLYGVYLAQTKYLRKGGYDDEELIDVAVKAVSATFHATKRKKIRNLVGYFSGTLSRMFDRMYEEEISDLSGYIVGGQEVALQTDRYNWLEA